ncbi:sialidase family protein [Noviherbaspirillum sp. 1P10PC]|uniref:exo-alpha-sialidase n=1 Tax=Noviherbaspirillum sp. 1P10PC TaxID=3132292 RepID=UPI0039A2DF3F
MNTLQNFRIFTTAILAAVALTAASPAAPAQGHEGHGHGSGTASASQDLGTAAAFDRNGRLWAVSKETEGRDQYVALRSSEDMGKTWTAPRRIQKAPEPIAARGEARPHIAFGNKDEIYITYTSTVAMPHIGDIRFVRSTDGGQTFSAPVTVHANRDFIVHSFESIVVDRDGRIYIAWIDSRDAEKAKKRQERYAGSGVYYAVSSDQGATFKGDYKISDHSCECCRIGLALNLQDKPVALWRHVFAPNIRDHALAELQPDGVMPAPVRVTFDDWRIDACPHHGPSLAYTADGTRHQVWFNGKEGDGGGVQYAAAKTDGTISKPVPLGSAQASHADVAAQGKQVAIVWKQFDGQSTAIVSRISEDGGNTWKESELARTEGESDKPYLATAPTGLVLVWRTQKEGIRVVPVGRGKA